MTKADKVNYVIIGIVVIIFISVTGGLYLIFRRNKYQIKQGELSGEDVITIMETWDSKSNQVIAGLHPKVRDIYTNFINDLSEQGISYRLYNGTRTFDKQAELYGKGRTEQELITAGVDKKYAKPNEKKVTNAKPGSSFHNYGLAGDGVEIKDGKAIWDSLNKQKIATTGAKYGLYWGGNFTSFKDEPHFEYQGFGNISTLLAIYNTGNIDQEGYIILT